MDKRPPDWQPLDLSRLTERLSEVKRLLEQAAALAAAEEGRRALAMTRVQQEKAEQAHAEPHRRRYR
jgi:hypothetical protein